MSLIDLGRVLEYPVKEFCQHQLLLWRMTATATAKGADRLADHHMAATIRITFQDHLNGVKRCGGVVLTSW